MSALSRARIENPSSNGVFPLHSHISSASTHAGGRGRHLASPIPRTQSCHAQSVVRIRTRCLRAGLGVGGDEALPKISMKPSPSFDAWVFFFSFLASSSLSPSSPAATLASRSTALSSPSSSDSSSESQSSDDEPSSMRSRAASTSNGSGSRRRSPGASRSKSSAASATGRRHTYRRHPPPRHRGAVDDRVGRLRAFHVGAAWLARGRSRWDASHHDSVDTTGLDSIRVLAAARSKCNPGSFRHFSTASGSK